MDVRQLRTFLAVAELGSLRQAALRLRIAETALSRQMRLLEADLGVPLFRRHGRGLALTEGGQALRERAAPLLHGIETLRDEMRGMQGQVSGAVSIGLPWLLLERLSAGLARRFIPAHPGIGIRFIGGFADHLQDAMLSGEADLALMFDPAPARALRLSPLFREEMRLVAHAVAGYRAEVPQPFRRLSEVPLVLPGPRNPFRQRLERLALGHGVSLDVRFEVESLAPQKALVLGGVAQMLASTLAVGAEVAAGMLCETRLADEPIIRTLYLAEPRAGARSRAAARLAEAVREEAAGWSVGEGATGGGLRQA